MDLALKSKWAETGKQNEDCHIPRLIMEQENIQIQPKITKRTCTWLRPNWDHMHRGWSRSPLVFVQIHFWYKFMVSALKNYKRKLEEACTCLTKYCEIRHWFLVIPYCRGISCSQWAQTSVSQWGDQQSTTTLLPLPCASTYNQRENDGGLIRAGILQYRLFADHGRLIRW